MLFVHWSVVDPRPTCTSLAMHLIYNKRETQQTTKNNACVNHPSTITAAWSAARQSTKHATVALCSKQKVQSVVTSEHSRSAGTHALAHAVSAGAHALAQASETSHAIGCTCPGPAGCKRSIPVEKRIARGKETKPPGTSATHRIPRTRASRRCTPRSRRWPGTSRRRLIQRSS